MRVLTQLMAAAALLFSGVVSAQDIEATRCDGCTASQMQNVALQQGLGIRYVYNLPGGVIVGYWVTDEDIYLGQYVRMAVPVMPEGWILDQFAAIHQFYLDNGGSLTAALSNATPAASGGHVNAYDVVGSSKDRNAVVNDLHDNPRLVFTSVFASFGRAIKLTGLVSPDPDLTVKAMFPDGSYAYFKFNWDTKEWEYVSKSAVDSHGNSIPETPEDFTNGGAGGSYDFSGPGNPNDVNDFLHRAWQAGVPVHGGGIRWGCTSAGGGPAACFPY